MSDFLASVKNVASQPHSIDWLSDIRAKGLKEWGESEWPTRKTENWKYTPLRPLTNFSFESLGGKIAFNESDFGTLTAIPDLETHKIVFINGVFSESLSDDSFPLEIVRFSQASEDQKGLIKERLASVVDSQKHLFGALNNAWVDDGIFVHVKKNAVIDKPIQIVHISASSQQSVCAQARLFVLLEANAKASIIEHYVSPESKQNVLLNALSEIVLSDGAHLNHYRLNLEEEHALHVGGVHAELNRNSQLRGFALGQGGELKRIDYAVKHLGEGAHLDLQGVYLPQNKQVIDYHTEIEHCVPHCTSNEVFRGIIADSAKAVFNGRIHIHPDAQKTLAEMSNKNLLLSDQAEVDTKPELEIYADDVRCAHGATISQINDQELFYLKSRGISEQEAKVMLSFGFINEVLREAEEEAIQEYLRPRLAFLFGRDESLVKHLLHDDQE